MLGKAKPGNRNIIVGGGAIGCEMALHLALSGKKSIVVEMLPEIAGDVPGMAKGALLTALNDTKVDCLTNTRIIEIIDSGVIASDQNQNKLNLNGDRIILAMGLVSQTELYDELKDIVSEIYLIGDCFEPHKVGEATRDGFRIASIL